jgi:hypothetical protein
MRFTVAVSIMSCFVLFSCSVNQSNFRQPLITPKSTVLYPAIGEVNTISLGDKLVESSTGYYSPVLIIKNDFKVSNMYRVSNGVYLFTHDDGKYKYYCPSDVNQLAEINVFGEDLNHDCRLRLSKKNSLSIIANDVVPIPSAEIYPSSIYFWELDDHHYFEDKDNFQQTMIYTGKSGNTIRFSYREFSSNRIRDPFTTEILYDLTESNIIAYKSFKAEIIEATNSSITFKITSGF